ncbi:MAG: 23S rRNA (uracil(1939)-C(5))-methyltransferase RlmD [bacterium]
MRKGEIIDLHVEDLAFGGKAVARAEGMVVFIDAAVPGDFVRARITRRKPQYAEAVIEQILELSPARQQPACRHFGTCGGCKWQYLPYQEQLKYKQQHAADALRHIGRNSSFIAHPILPSPQPWHYRNKMEFSFGSSPSGSIEVGLHQKGDFRRIVNIEQCMIQPSVLDDVLGYLRDEINQGALENSQRLTPYNNRNHTGFLRHLVMRHSHSSGQFLVALITASGAWPELESITGRFTARFPACGGFLWGVNDGLSDVARIESLRFMKGDGFIEERLNHQTFRVSAFSFFQTNTAGAELLYDTVRQYCELEGSENVLDAYCGTGTIGIHLSRYARSVTGIELVPQAVDDARCNAVINNAQNCTFIAADMRSALRSLSASSQPHFDRIVVDPPRGGMDKKALRMLIELGAPLIVYVSCNPTTLARDLVTLAEGGYEPEDVQPVDMFPHTYHVESVVKFRRCSQVAPA